MEGRILESLRSKMTSIEIKYVKNLVGMARRDMMRNRNLREEPGINQKKYCEQLPGVDESNKLSQKYF